MKIKNNIVGFFILFFILPFILIETFIIHDIYKYSKRHKEEDYIIILGAKLNNFEPSQVLKHRLDTAINYTHKYPNVKIIVSGGKNYNEKISEAEVMRNYLIKNNIKKEQIILENKSTSTYENLKFSFKLIKKNSRVAVVSNDYHIFRSKLIANFLEVPIDGIYTKTYSNKFYSSLIKEYFKIIHEITRYLLKKEYN
ncbi:MAG: YdcF family protein [Cetobacterium sp.]|uniref:YdcF family protein n=1 Tax=unclassified Cetobacterium TaxID=2630983 RepID=UPI00163B6631|nr:YdcF family protein [Cetobacterium sp. 2A]MBC2856904.1 YdcF family protein [Cetobacterium sp. 2A]